MHLITSPTIINQVGGRFELHISVWGLLFRVEPSMWYFLVIFTLVLLFIFKINFIGITSRYTCCLLLVSTGRPSKEHVCPGIAVLHRLPQYFSITILLPISTTNLSKLLFRRENLLK